MKLILFDIDGTLLWTDGAGRRAIHRALLDETGTAGPIDGYRFDGKTDPQIVRELLELAGHPDARSETCVTAVCRRYVDLLTAELAKPTQVTKLYPGISELLAALEPPEAAGRAVVGLLTGNVEHGAALKLRSAGLDPARFVVGAFGSDSGRRSDLPAIAAERAGRKTGGGHRFTGAELVIVGDTPDDVACGRPIGARTVAVATGSYDVAALRAAGATHVFQDLVFRGAMLDRRFDRKERLQRRDEVVRLRVFHPDDGSAGWGVLGWKGPVGKRDGYRHREEWESRVDDPRAVLVVLRRLGYKIVLRIDRTVEQYRLGDATLRLEWYPAMDVLLEVEGPPEDIERAIAATGLARKAFLPESLPYFTDAYEKRTGRT